MIKNLLNIKNVKLLNAKQQKMVKGGYIPTPYQFCCGYRPQSFWLQDYPFLANDPSYNCSGDICSGDGNW